MAKSRSALDLKALQSYAVPEIRAQLGPETLVRRFTVLVPVEEVKKGHVPRRIASDDHLLQIQLRLAKDFGGLTTSITVPSLVGWGARDPRRPRQTVEVNRHAYYSVYAAAERASDEYFLVIQKQLALALGEGLILIERQDVTIL